MGGKPCLRGSRVTVDVIAGLASLQYTDEAILEAYPYLEAEDIRAAVEYADLPSGVTESLSRKSCKSRINVFGNEGKDKTNEIIFLVEEASEGGYTARAMGQSIFTEADTLDELRANVSEAVQAHFGEGATPKIIRLHLVHDEVLAA